MCESCQVLAATSKFWLADKALSWLAWCVHGAVGLAVLRVLLGTVLLHFRIFLAVFVWQHRWCIIHFFFNSCSHTVVFVWICAVQKGHLVAKWKIGDMNYRGNCLLQEEMMGDRIPGNPQALHHQTVFEPFTLWNWPVCRFRIPKPGVFLNIPCIFQLWLRAEECTESVVCLFVYLFIFLTVVLSGTGNFLLSSTCLVPSLQSHGVVPNNTERKTGRGEKKKEILILLCCIVQFRKAEYLCLVVRFQNCRKGEVRPFQYRMCTGQEVWTTAFLPASVCDTGCRITRL